MNNQSTSVHFEHVHKTYGNVTAIDDLSLTINAGELVTILGPSGCGKTTTLRMIAGLEDASSGRISIGSDDVTDLSATYRNVAMVFQSYALFPHMSVLDNVSYGLSVTSMPKKKMLEKAHRGLEMVGLAGFGDRLPSELSGGQQQRVAVARAVVLEPDVLLFDEPLSNLDAKMRRHVREEIRQLQQELGLTAVYVTHDQEEAMAVSDKIIVMRDGVIAQTGTPSDLYERPNSEFIADFIGNANLIPCEVLDTVDGQSKVAVGEVTLSAKTTGTVDTLMKLVAHPQNIEFAQQCTANTLRGKIRHSAYLGNQVEYDVDSEVGTLFVVDRQMENRYRQGEEVYLKFREDKTVLVPAK